MTHIKFSDSELTELQNFYRLEYNKTLEKLQNIKGLLSKLKSTNGTTANGSTVTRKRTVAQRSTTNNTNRVVSPIGRKIGKWPTFILDTLGKQKKFVKSNVLFDSAKRQFNISDKDTKKQLRNLRGHLLRMSKKNEIAAQAKKGQRDKLYGLTTK